MKFVLNQCYGGFGLSDWATKQLNLRFSYGNIERDDPKLIELVEKFPDKVSGECAELGIVEIPDDCTDYEFIDYDGIESIIYVVDGKIHHA